MTTSTLAHTSKTTSLRTADGISFALALALDSGSYVIHPGSPGKLTATLTLRCPENAPLTLEFTNGQEFEIEIDDAGGDRIVLWSAGQKFFDHVQTVTVQGERHWTATMALPQPPVAFPPPKPGGAPEVASRYTATAYLKNVTVVATAAVGGVHPDVAQPIARPRLVASPRLYSATVAFTVHGDPVILEGASSLPPPAVDTSAPSARQT